MKTPAPVFKFTATIVILAYLIFGFCFLHIPKVDPDELWELSRIHYLMKHGTPGEPMLPEAVSPFLSQLYSATPISPLVGIVKSFFYFIILCVSPLYDVFDIRLANFIWSLAACFFLFRLSLKFGLPGPSALFSVLLLIAAPEFFSQLHRERPEIIITACFTAALLFYLHVISCNEGIKKNLLLAGCGLFAGLLPLFIHPSAIVIPVTIGLLHLFAERRKIFRPQSVVFALFLCAGVLALMYVMNETARVAAIKGGGSVLDRQGLPVLTKGLSYLFKVPLLFWNKLSAVHLTDRPVSFLYFCLAAASLFMLFRKSGEPLIKYPPVFLVVSVVVPVLVLLLLSGSYGNYLIIVFPVLALSIAAACRSLLFGPEPDPRLFTVIMAVLLLVSGLNFQSIKLQSQQTSEYFRILKEVKSAIPESDQKVVGTGLYYMEFKDQPFYSYSWLNPDNGKPDQTFRQAMMALDAGYVILDDAFVGKARLDRGSRWADDMINFLNEEGEKVKEISCRYLMKARVPEPSLFPDWWRYEGQQRGVMQRIIVYKIR